MHVVFRDTHSGAGSKDGSPLDKRYAGRNCSGCSAVAVPITSIVHMFLSVGSCLHSAEHPRNPTRNQRGVRSTTGFPSKRRTGDFSNQDTIPLPIPLNCQGPTAPSSFRRCFHHVCNPVCSECCEPENAGPTMSTREACGVEPGAGCVPNQETISSAVSKARL